MNKFFKFCMISSLVFGLCACEDKKDDDVIDLKITDSAKEQSFTAAAGSKMISVKSGGALTVTVEDNQTWCTVSDVKERYFTINVDKNLVTQVRTSTVTVSQEGSPSIDITVTQAAFVVELSVDPPVIALTRPSATTCTATFTTNRPDWPCTVIPGANWLEAAIEAGGELTITVKRNTLPTPRTSTVTLRMEDVEDAVITVTQEASIPLQNFTLSKTDAIFYLSTSGFTSPNLPQTVAITLDPPNADVEPADINWTSDHPAIVTVNADGQISRVANATGTTTVRCAIGAIEKTVGVTVAPNPALSATGLWLFNEASDLGKATLGTDLTPVVASGYLTPINGGVCVGATSYFACTPGIATAGNGYITEYTMLFDFSVPAIGEYRSFFFAKPTTGSSNEAGIYISPSGTIGHGDYSTFVVTVNTWYRLVVVYKGDGYHHLYRDGTHIRSHNSYGAATKELESTFRLFTDGYGGAYDKEMSVSTTAIWDYALTDAEITALGAFE
jgi:hypothetical protein